MRIAFTAHLSEISGSGTALVAVAAAFQNAGHEAFFVIPGHGELEQRARAAGVEVVVLENPEQALLKSGLKEKLEMLRARQRYVSRLRQFLLKQRIDVAYVNSSASIFAGVAAYLAGVPVVWHIHETMTSPNAATRIKQRIIRQVARQLIYASESSRRSFPPGRLPSMIARNAVNMTRLRNVRKTRETRMAHTSSKQGDYIILMHGTVALKGADLLLAAMDLLYARETGRTLRAIITGSPDTHPEFYKKLDHLADSEPLRGQVELAGIQSSLAKFLEVADVYVSPSRAEAMPIAVVEAMAAGVPVVATNVGDCSDLLDHGGCGWVIPPEDATALAHAIAEVLQDPTEARHRANAAAQKTDALYGGEAFWDELIHFVKQAAST